MKRLIVSSNEERWKQKTRHEANEVMIKLASALTQLTLLRFHNRIQAASLEKLCLLTSAASGNGFAGSYLSLPLKRKSVKWKCKRVPRVLWRGAGSVRELSVSWFFTTTKSTLLRTKPPFTASVNFPVAPASCSLIHSCPHARHFASVMTTV